MLMDAVYIFFNGKRFFKDPLCSNVASYHMGAAHNKKVHTPAHK